jgi:hypothetical protein
MDNEGGCDSLDMGLVDMEEKMMYTECKKYKLSLGASRRRKKVSEINKRS